MATSGCSVLIPTPSEPESLAGARLKDGGSDAALGAPGPAGRASGSVASSRAMPPAAGRRFRALGRSLRALARTVALSAFTLGIYVVVQAGSLVLGGRQRCRWRRFVLGVWSRGCLRLLGGRVSWEGEPPAAPFLLVANHLSYLDIVVLGSRLPAIFVAKVEVADWPLIGPLVRAGGTIFLDRGRKRDLPRALGAIEDALARGAGVILFPEGTSSDGSTVLPFRSSLLELPARRAIPIHTAALAYRTPCGESPAALAVCWWGGMELPQHLWGLLQIPRVEAVVRLGREPVTATDRKQLALRLRRDVAAGVGVAENPGAR